MKKNQPVATFGGGVQSNGEGVQENLLRVMGMVYILIGIWVTWVLAFTKSDQTLIFKT